MRAAAARPTVNLVELVIVVAILGILAALIIPRISRGESDALRPELRSQLSVLRTAIELYYQDHGAYPGAVGAGPDAGRPGSAAAFVSQMNGFTDAHGRVSAQASDTYRFGPYLRSGIPACPVGANSGKSAVHVVTDQTVPACAPDAPDAGWVYNCLTGYIVVNAEAVDADGVRYDRY